MGGLMKKSNIERFNKKYIISESGCWIWTGSLHKDGYGNFWTGLNRSNGNPILDLAHRWSFTEFVEDINEGNYVLHNCDNPPCVNPKHLYQGTQRVNMKDCVDKGRHPRQKTVLTETQVNDIRSKYSGKYGEIRLIAKEYGVAPNVLSVLLKNQPKKYGHHIGARSHRKKNL